MPYFHIDPRDIGREYRPVRVNSQSGKAGAAYILLHDYKLDLPREIQIEFAGVVQRVTEETNAELSSQDIWNLFRQEYLQRDNPLRLMEHWSGPGKRGSRHVRATIMFNGELVKVSADGNGEVNAFVNAITPVVNLSIEVLTLHEHAVAMGSDASAISYVPIRVPGREYVGGVAMSTDTTKANLLAVVSAVNRVLGKK